MEKSNNQEFAHNDHDMSILDAINFLKNAWKTIILFAFLGIFASVAYLFLTPYQYEASAQIRLAQINFSLPTAPLGTPVEDQASLLARLNLPSNYSHATIRACGYEEKQDPAQTLARDLKFSIARGMVNIIELRLRSTSPKKALDCANAVVLQIGLLQDDMIKPYVEEAKAQLIIINEQLDSAKRIIAKADQSGGGAISAAYLAARDEAAFSLVEREKKLAIISSAKQRQTKLVSPIYVSEKPVYPKKTLSLLMGLLGGGIFGFFLTVGQQILPRLKT